ncbi:MAG: undecaprenyl-diphosphatase, partial [Firmicutes bacterium]|nr:undecaprenyl-diphosphatase [Bacillota bacterium]
WGFIDGGFSFDISAGVMLAGFIAAFISGLACIKFMLKFVANRSMNVFAVYLALLTVFLAVDKLWLHAFG